MAIVPFQIKIKDKVGPWKAVIAGKTVELASPQATREEADEALKKLLPSSDSISTAAPKKSFNLFGTVKNSETPAVEPSLNSTDSAATPSPKDEKPKPGELRKNGLAELTPAKLAAFKTQVASAIAAGNVTLDRALVAIFRDNVPVIPAESYMLLATGWELACEQYFVNGVPPAWLIITLGNILVCTSLYEKSEAKKEEPIARAAISPDVRTAANK